MSSIRPNPPAPRFGGRFTIPTDNFTPLANHKIREVFRDYYADAFLRQPGLKGSLGEQRNKDVQVEFNQEQWDKAFSEQLIQKGITFSYQSNAQLEQARPAYLRTKAVESVDSEAAPDQQNAMSQDNRELQARLAKKERQLRELSERAAALDSQLRTLKGKEKAQ